MKTISAEQLEKVHESLRALSERDIKKFLRDFQKQQEPLLVYLSAVAEREEMNDPEYELLIDGSLLFWKLTRDASGRQKKLAMTEIDEADNALLERLDQVADAGDERLLEIGSQEVARLRSYDQPHLIDFLLRHVLETSPESGIRKEMTGILFLNLCNVLELLLRASSVGEEYR